MSGEWRPEQGQPYQSHAYSVVVSTHYIYFKTQPNCLLIERRAHSIKNDNWFADRDKQSGGGWPSCLARPQRWHKAAMPCHVLL